MTREHNLKIIYDACVAVNPDIGALPPYPYNPDAAKACVELASLFSLQHISPEHEFTANEAINAYREQQRNDYIKLLRNEYPGRPIRLADVLVSINDEPNNFFYYSTKEVRMDYLDEKDKVINVWWNLLKDDLNDQTDETLEAIAKLLI